MRSISLLFATVILVANPHGEVVGRGIDADETISACASISQNPAPLGSNITLKLAVVNRADSPAFISYPTVESSAPIFRCEELGMPDGSLRIIEVPPNDVYFLMRILSSASVGFSNQAIGDQIIRVEFDQLDGDSPYKAKTLKHFGLEVPLSITNMPEEFRNQITHRIEETELCNSENTRFAAYRVNVSSIEKDLRAEAIRLAPSLLDDIEKVAPYEETEILKSYDAYRAWDIQKASLGFYSVNNYQSSINLIREILGGEKKISKHNFEETYDYYLPKRIGDPDPIGARIRMSFPVLLREGKAKAIEYLQGIESGGVDCVDQLFLDQLKVEYSQVEVQLTVDDITW